MTFTILTVPFYFYFWFPSWGLVIATLIVWALAGIGVTAGYHRYFSHKTYQTNKVVEAILLFFGTIALQSTVLLWSCDHRRHHKWTDDNEKDPYSIERGFWYAHMGWMLDKNHQPLDPTLVPDLMKNKLVMFQHNHYYLLAFASNLLVFLLVGWLFNDFIGAFFLTTLTRWFFVHHFTFFINSLAHTWGSRMYTRELSAVDNYILAFLTFGEGYHNYHHAFSGDYRNGVKWYHFDPGKWFIWSMYKIGWVTNPIRVNKYTIKKRLIMEDKPLLLDEIKKTISHKREVFEKKVYELSDQFSTKVAEINQLLRQYQFSKKIKVKKETKTLRIQIKEKKKDLRKYWKEWLRLSKSITHYKPSAPLPGISAV